LQWSEVLQWSGNYLACDLQISLSETLVWRAAEMVQRLNLTSLTAPEDEEHTEAATDVPMQMNLVSISKPTGKVLQSQICCFCLCNRCLPNGTAFA